MLLSCLLEGVTLDEVFQQTPTETLNVCKYAEHVQEVPFILLEMSQGWLAELTHRDQHTGQSYSSSRSTLCKLKRRGRGLQIQEFTLQTRNGN